MFIGPRYRSETAEVDDRRHDRPYWVCIVLRQSEGVGTWDLSQEGHAKVKIGLQEGWWIAFYGQVMHSREVGELCFYGGRATTSRFESGL